MIEVISRVSSEEFEAISTLRPSHQIEGKDARRFWGRSFEKTTNGVREVFTVIVDIPEKTDGYRIPAGGSLEIRLVPDAQQTEDRNHAETLCRLQEMRTELSKARAEIAHWRNQAQRAAEERNTPIPSCHHSGLPEDRCSYCLRKTIVLLEAEKLAIALNSTVWVCEACAERIHLPAICDVRTGENFIMTRAEESACALCDGPSESEPDAKIYLNKYPARTVIDSLNAENSKLRVVDAAARQELSNIHKYPRRCLRDTVTADEEVPHA